MKPPHVVVVPLLLVCLGFWTLSWRIYLPLVLVRADHPVIATRTPTASATASAVRTATPTPTVGGELTDTPSPSTTPTSEVIGPTPSSTATPSSTPTATGTPTAEPTSTTTATPTASPSPSPSSTPTLTAMPTYTPTPTQTPTRTSTPSRTPSPTVTVTFTPATAELRIGYIQFSGGDEYVRVDNVGAAAQNMSGWSIQSYDGATCAPLASQIYWFPSGYVLGAGQSVRVHSGPDAVSTPPGDLKWTGSTIWNNDGDRGNLRNASGAVVSTYGYGRCK